MGYISAQGHGTSSRYMETSTQCDDYDVAISKRYQTILTRKSVVAHSVRLDFARRYFGSTSHTTKRIINLEALKMQRMKWIDYFSLAQPYLLDYQVMWWIRLHGVGCQ